MGGAYCPGAYHYDLRLAYPTAIGSYRSPRGSDEPMVVHMYRIPNSPGKPVPEQLRAGRRELLDTSFEDYEREIRDQLNRMLAGADFDAARDIGAITVNRWAHGYGVTLDPDSGRIAYDPESWPPARRHWHLASRRFGRIAIANSDAASNAMTEAAIGEASRAVLDLIGEA